MKRTTKDVIPLIIADVKKFKTADDLIQSLRSHALVKVDQSWLEESKKHKLTLIDPNKIIAFIEKHYDCGWFEGVRKFYDLIQDIGKLK